MNFLGKIGLSLFLSAATLPAMADEIVLGPGQSIAIGDNRVSCELDSGVVAYCSCNPGNNSFYTLNWHYQDQDNHSSSHSLGTYSGQDACNDRLATHPSCAGERTDRFCGCYPGNNGFYTGMLSTLLNGEVRSRTSLGTFPSKNACDTAVTRNRACG